MGHPGATAIYPPLTQWLIAAMASFGFGPFGFKVLFTLADMALCFLLCRRFGAKPALIYAWNPLGAVSFAGGGHYDSLFMLAMLVSWIWVGLKSRTLLEAAQRGFLATYLLSPMLHAWYFVWALPFAVKSGNAGFIALAASGILYFMVHHTLEQPGGTWTFTWWERAAIWLPFIIGFAYSFIGWMLGNSLVICYENNFRSKERN